MLELMGINLHSSKYIDIANLAKLKKVFTQKFGLHLVAVVISNIGVSSVALAQQPQDLYFQCYQQGNQYACQQYQLMIQRNEERRLQQQTRQAEMNRQRDYLRWENKRKSCQDNSYTFDTSHCDVDNPYK